MIFEPAEDQAGHFNFFFSAPNEKRLLRTVKCSPDDAAELAEWMRAELVSVKIELRLALRRRPARARTRHSRRIDKKRPPRLS